MNPITKNDSKVDNGNNYNNLKISKDKNEKESKINYWKKSNVMFKFFG